MTLKIPGGKPLQKTETSINKSVPIPKEESIPVGKINGVLIPFSIGLGVDTSGGAYVINVQTTSSGTKLVGFKTTKTIHNQTGAGDDYDYKVENITKATTLSSTTAHTLADGEFTVQTEFWSLDEVAPGDAIRYSITDGVIGTVAGRATLGTISFFVESIDEEQLS